MCTLKRILLLVAGFYLCSASMVEASDEGWHAFELRSGYIAIPVKANETEGWAALSMRTRGIIVNDSISKNFTQYDGRYLKSVHSTQRSTKVHHLDLEIFGSNISLRNLSSAPLGEFSVVLGRDLFDDKLLQIDYPNQRLRMLSKDSMANRNFGNLPARNSRYGLSVQLEIPANEDSFWLGLDTGSPGGLVINRKAADQHKLLANEPTGNALIDNLNGVDVEMERYTLPVLKIGPYVLEDVSLYVEKEGDSNPLIPANNRSIGFVGYDLYKHFVLTISYSDAQVHLSVPESL